jgi:hypothetical protein
MSTAVQETAGKLLERRNRLGKLFEKKGADGRFNWSATERDEAKALNDECDALGTELEHLRADELMETKNRQAIADLDQVRVAGSFQARPGTGRTSLVGPDGRSFGTDGAQTKSIGDLYVETKSFKGFREGYRLASEVPGFEVKTLFQTSAGFDPFVTRLSTVALSPQQMPKVVDLLPTSETRQHSIKWMLETVYTNAADTTAEGGAYPESALQFAEQLSPVVKIAVFIPVTDEQFEDEPRMRDMVNNRLENMLRQKLDAKLLTATGGSTELTGLLNITGAQTQARGTDPAPSAIFKATTLIQTVGFADPSGVIMNPTDWQNIKLLQTADGLYIWGHPSADTPNRIWGLPVVTTTYQTLGTAIVGDFLNHTELIYRRGVEFLVSNSHQDYFTNGKLAIRADIRVAFICKRVKAICKVTNL